MNEFIISSDLIDRPAELRARAAQEGYLFFRGLLSPQRLMQVRAEILELCRKHGWLKDGTQTIDGIAAPGVRHIEPEPAYMALYNELLCLESFHALAHDPAVLQVTDALFMEPTLVHARNIARIIFPQAELYTTPAHQDFIHIQGTPDVWTSWIPLGDCPRELGSLAVLPRTHTGGVYATHSAYGAGGRGIDTDSIPIQWASSDFRAGDVLMFHSLTIHKALPNLTPDRLRLSVDYRYQAPSRSVVEASFQPHHGQVTWEQVYAGWKNDELKYYWRKVPLNLVDWQSMYQPVAAPPSPD